LDQTESERFSDPGRIHGASGRSPNAQQAVSDSTRSHEQQRLDPQERFMKRFHIVRVAVVAIAFSAIFVTNSNEFAVRASLSDTTATPVIKVTPPAPVFDEKERLAELAQRRARVAEKIGPRAALILFSTEPRVYANDVDYDYRQENNLYYLTNLKQKGATLILLPGNSQTPEILFLPRRDPAAETWTGHMYSPQEALELSGIKEIWAASEFDPFIAAFRKHEAYRPKDDKIFMTAVTASAQPGPSGFENLFDAAVKNQAELYMLVPRNADTREYKQEQRFAADWPANSGGFTVKNANQIFSDMRLSKSPMELRLLQHAIDITTEAQERAWAAAGTAKWEYEVDAQVAFTFKLRNADHWGYPSIVGCGPNATTLHYTESQGAIKPDDLLLMDVGAEYGHYTADVTRTIPINGKFSPAQADVYRIVYDAQEAVAKATRPGGNLSDVNRAGTEVIKEGLLKLGLITNKNSEQYRMWFMHGTSHWLGMNVHDVGGASRFVPGAVFTNEPGIYVRPDALDYLPYGWNQQEWDKFKAAIRPAFEKYKGIGVRIEDDMLVTADGVKWMTEALPRKLEDIEEFIAKARRELSMR
jgi:Xaa-Pro aminopeptidase